MAAANPKLKGVVLGAHGLFTWGNTARDCYETTLRDHQQGRRLAGQERQASGLRRREGGVLPADERKAVARA
jgi:rhamnose utilization protein RhaD (predicted bifunctional aldolase and dehydrogenase)